MNSHSDRSRRPGEAHALRALSVAVCSAIASASDAIALAACFHQFDSKQPIGDDNLVWLQLTPAGNFSPRDGRPMQVPHWHIDAAVAKAVIARFKADKTPPVIDYEHQTLNIEKNGQPAPAAGRLVDMQWRDGQGLYGQVALTSRAKQFIADGEYLYFSPVFLFHPQTGDVQKIVMGAMTNNPALDGMEPLALRAAARYAFNQESTMNKLLVAVCVMLGLTAESTTEDQAIAALDKHAKADPLAKLRAELGLDAKADEPAVLAACTSLKARAVATDPDPAKFIGIDAFNSLRTDFAALTAKLNGSEVDKLVDEALACGRLLKPQEAWARSLGAKDVASLKAYIDSAAPIAALVGTQTGGKTPKEVEDPESGLTESEMAVCKKMGITPEAFAKSKKDK